MKHVNRLHRIISALGRLPGPARSRSISLLMGQMVPFVGTSRLSIRQMTPERVVVRVSNRRRNRNHIGQVHAAAMALAAETATGFVVGMNAPDSSLILIKTMKVDFKKRSKGDLVAEATLSEEERRAIGETEKGELSVRVRVTDETGEEPIRCEMIWAWIPRKRKT